jgi:hypothetical protein
LYYWGHDHLSDPITPHNRKRFRSVIDDNDADLTTIISINSPRRIDERYTLFQGKTRTRSDLCFEA